MDFRELGIGIVPYSPLGRGFFGGRGVKEQVSAESVLVLIQSTSEYHFFLLLPKNKIISWSASKSLS